MNDWFLFFFEKRNSIAIKRNICCVLSISKEDSAKKKLSGIAKVFDILSNFNIFVTEFKTTVFYVTTWKLLCTLWWNFLLQFVLAQTEKKIAVSAFKNIKHAALSMMAHCTHRGNK